MSIKTFCVDIGTSSIKGGIIDDAGNLLNWGRIGLLERGAFDFELWDADSWLTALTELVGELELIGDISAVAMSGNGPTIVPVDRAGAPVASTLHWADSKVERIPDEPSFFLPKIRWMKHNQAEAYLLTDCLLPCPDFLTFALTGQRTAAIPSVDFQKFLWTDNSIRRYGLDAQMLPPFIEIGERIGHVTPQAARRFGLPEGVPVYAGGSDFFMALLGTAAVRAGRTCDRAGTSEGINYCSGVQIFSDRLRTLPHVIDGFHNIAGILSSTGRIFEWFRDVSGQRSRPYEEMLGEIIDLDNQCPRPVFIPSLHSGPTWEFRGAAFMDLEPEHGIPEMGRAVIESIAFSVRDVVETLEQNDCKIDVIRVSGGQARSAKWNQMKADITGKEIWVPRVVDAELVGNAAAAFTGMGGFDSLQKAAEELVGFQAVYKPDDEKKNRYDLSYRRFSDICGRIVGIISDYLNSPKR